MIQARPDIASIIELMQPLQNGELSSAFSSRVNIGLPNVTEITISAELINKLVMDEDYVMFQNSSGKPQILVGASRDLNLSFSANQELTEKDKELSSTQRFTQGVKFGIMRALFCLRSA